MNEYFALVVPLLFGIILILFFQKKVTWWEMLLPIVICLIAIFSMKSCDSKMNVRDVEYLTQHVVTASYEEAWNEWIKKTCSEQYPCGTETYSTGSGKNSSTSTRTKYCTRYYDCSYCKTHPAEWYITDDNGSSFSISESYYKQITKNWVNEKFINMNRHYYTINGNKYITKWNDNKKYLITTHNTESYENRIQASHSMYNFVDVSDTDKIHFNLFEYPNIDGYSQNSVLSYNYHITQMEQDYVNTINGLLGKSKQIQVFVCIWKNKSRDVSILQQAYWKGGNKNEVIICIGVDKNDNVTWGNVFTWSEKEVVKVKIRDYIMDNKGKHINLLALTDFAFPIIEKGWVRKNFHDFDFIAVQLTDTQVMWIYIMVILLSLGLSAFAILNNIDPNYQDNTKDVQLLNKIKTIFKRK